MDQAVFLRKYPRIARLLSVFAIDVGLDLEQIRGIVTRAIAADPSLKTEIDDAFADQLVRWREVLDNPQAAEVYSTDSEETARAYAAQMFLKATQS
jgi:hypothetical protein